MKKKTFENLFYGFMGGIIGVTINEFVKGWHKLSTWILLFIIGFLLWRLIKKFEKIIYKK
jgi:hypothetical protein